jgi:hypothetical protein
MSNIGAFEAVDVSHPFLLTFALAHILLFFLQGAISHMVTLFLAIKASERGLDPILNLLLALALIGRVLVGVHFNSMTLILLIFIYTIQVTNSASEDICLRETRVSTRQINMNFRACALVYVR